MTNCPIVNQRGAAGSVPLPGYLFEFSASQFTVSAVMTLLTLFVVGASRALVTNEKWIPAGLEMLVVGAAAAAVAYGVGAWIAGIT